MTSASRDASTSSNVRPLVSVVIPCYNAERWVAEAVDSALSQTYEPMEIIAVNDGSSDTTGSILASYGTAVHTITQENAGLSGARNAAILQAKGEYVAFLDADDVWAPTKTEQQMQFLLANPRFGLIGSGCYQIDENSQHIGTCPVICEEAPWITDDPPIQDASELNLHLSGNCVGSPSGMIVSKALLDSINSFNVDLPDGGEDWDFLLRLVGQTSIASYSAELFGYRFSGQGLSSPQNAGKMLRAELKVVQAFFARQKPPISKSTLAQIKANRYLVAARAYLNHGESQECRRAVVQAVRHSPKLLFDKRSIYLLCVSFIGESRLRRLRS